MPISKEDAERGVLADKLQVAKLRYTNARRKLMAYLPRKVSREVLDAKHEVERLESELFELDWGDANADAAPPDDKAGGG